MSIDAEVSSNNDNDIHNLNIVMENNSDNYQVNQISESSNLAISLTISLSSGESSESDSDSVSSLSSSSSSSTNESGNESGNEINNDSESDDNDDDVTKSFLKNECAICLEPLEVDDYSVLDKCFHKFHEKCIRDWFKVSHDHICPVCNTVNTARLTIKNNNKAKLPELSVVKIKTIKQGHRYKNHQVARISPILTTNSTPIPTDSDVDTCSRKCGCIIS